MALTDFANTNQTLMQTSRYWDFPKPKKILMITRWHHPIKWSVIFTILLNLSNNHHCVQTVNSQRIPNFNGQLLCVWLVLKIYTRHLKFNMWLCKVDSLARNVHPICELMLRKHQKYTAILLQNLSVNLSRPSNEFQVTTHIICLVTFGFSCWGCCCLVYMPCCGPHFMHESKD